LSDALPSWNESRLVRDTTGPAQGLLDSKVGTFTPELYDAAVKKNWTVISMKDDWKKNSFV
jgi:hypothetical protein